MPSPADSAPKRDPFTGREELPVRGAAYEGERGSIHGLFSSRLGCDTIYGAIDLTALCIRGT